MSDLPPYVICFVWLRRTQGSLARQGSGRITGTRKELPIAGNSSRGVAERSVLQRGAIRSICWVLSVAKVYCVTLGNGGRIAQWPRPRHLSAFPCTCDLAPYAR